MARPSKPYHQSWDNQPVPGLYRCPDGRWRLKHNGKDIKYTEPDEHKAIARYHAIIGTNADSGLQITREGFVRTGTTTLFGVGEIHRGHHTHHYVSQDEFWQRVTQELTERPQNAARMTGIPQLANLANMNLPQAPIKLTSLRDLYRDHNDAKSDSKREACNTFDSFIKITGATTLADLTTDALKVYRDAIKAQVQSPGTIAAYFGRCKWIIGFGKSEGEDAAQIDAALSRMTILKAPKDTRTHNPTPISPEHFHTLYAKAGELYPGWQPRLMLMLNLCLHFDECLDLEWDDFDLKAGTFCTHRNKRGRVIRAATLWPETLKTLKAIRRNGSTYVLVSGHGTRFNAKGQWKTWNRLRVAAGCQEVQMDDIRDGAYTAACSADVDEKYARLLAGHRSHGLQDNYVARNAAIVRPACDAVHRRFFQ